MAKGKVKKVVHFSVTTTASSTLVENFNETIDKMNDERRLNDAPVMSNGQLLKRLMASVINDPKGTLKFINYDKVD
jgi:hypothetical protein